MATAVRPPGYYTSWLHVVTDIPSTSTGINLYTWIGDWTERNYGHRWTNTSKKLNAILTIQPGSILTAPDYTTAKLNTAINPVNVLPPILIPDDFRDFDRITIINLGQIIGAYGFRDFSGSGTFTPPSTVSQNNIILTQRVNRVTMDVAGGGGAGGNSNSGGTGSGGGGGGAGGRCQVEDVEVTPGVVISASGGGSGQNASYTQSGNTLAAASAGGRGGDGTVRGYYGYCKARIGLPFGGSICLNTGHRVDPGSGGGGGQGGRNTITNIQNGNNGTAGGVGRQRYSDTGWCGVGAGGSGGVGAGGNGGAGGVARIRCDSNPTNGSAGGAGWLLYSYTQRQLFGPAIKNRHNNIRIINQGQIAGGYSTGQTIYAVYGAGLFEAPSWGTIYPITPGITNTII